MWKCANVWGREACSRTYSPIQTPKSDLRDPSSELRARDVLTSLRTQSRVWGTRRAEEATKPPEYELRLARPQWPRLKLVLLGLEVFLLALRSAYPFPSGDATRPDATVEKEKNPPPESLEPRRGRGSLKTLYTLRPVVYIFSGWWSILHIIIITIGTHPNSPMAIRTINHL